MRDLTRAELEDYFRFAKADDGAGDFNPEQGQLVADVVSDIGLLEAWNERIAADLLTGVNLNARDIVMSMWVAAFRMGRECESRLLTEALKGKK